MEFNQHQLKAYFKVFQPEEELGDHDVTSPDHIHIDFLRREIHRWEYRSYEGSQTQLVREGEDPPELLSECVDPHTFTCYDDSYEFIADLLIELDIDRCYHDRIVDEVISWGRRVGNCESNMGRKIIPLRVQIKLVHVHVCDERESVERITRQSILESESGNSGMLPASESSIRGLKRKRMESDGESCTICLEELPTGSKVTCMPCCHVFHQDCIRTWLDESHCCPICRFKMPTA